MLHPIFRSAAPAEAHNVSPLNSVELIGSLGLRIFLVGVVAHYELQFASISSEYQFLCLLGRHLKRYRLHFRGQALVFGRINLRPAG